MSSRCMIVALCGAVLWHAAVDAQVPAQVVSGIVRDQTGGAVPGARVTLAIESAPEAERPPDAVTDERGRFRLTNIPYGRYVVRVALEGFRPVDNVVQVSAAAPRPLEVTLHLLIAAHIEVTSNVGLAAGDNLASLVLRRAEIQALPSDGRLFWLRLAELAGLTGRVEDLSVYVDGFQRSIRLPPRDIIQMIRVNANPFAAEFHESGQRRVEIITTPGSEQLSGELTVNFSDGVLNARNAFATERPVEQYRRYSGWLSGPIIPGRWGFLAYGGRWEQDEVTVVHATTIDESSTRATQLVTDTVPTPMRTTSGLLKLNSMAGTRGIVTASYEHAEQTEDHRGVGGLNLRENGYTQSSVNDIAQFALATTFTRAFNELQIEGARRNAFAKASTAGPAIDVLDAFMGGGNQEFFDHASEHRRGLIATALTIAAGTHTIKAGGRFELIEIDDTNRSNFGGRFIFGSDFERDQNGFLILDASGQPIRIAPIEAYRRTVSGSPGYRPAQFTINQGDPATRFTDTRTSWFVQDDWRIGDSVTLSYGLRHFVQSNVRHGDNFGPRAAVAWTPDRDHKGSIRAGAGWFYDVVDDAPLLDAVRLDGRRLRQFVFQNPGFFPAVPPTLDLSAAMAPSIYATAPDLRAPATVVASLSYERPLPWDMLMFVGINWSRGSQLLRSLNINAPNPAGERPRPTDGPIIQLESTGRSERRELSVRWRKSFGSAVSTHLGYAFGSSRDDTDGPRGFPANGADLAAEFGPAADDIRHRATWSASIQLPGGVFLSPYAAYVSAPPLNILSGRDVNGDTIFNDRPGFARPGDPAAVETPYGLLTPTPGFHAPMIPRNFGRQQGRVEVSVSVIKQLPRQFTLSVDVTNAINAAHYTAFNGVLTNADFGRPTRALRARRIEVGFAKSF